MRIPFEGEFPVTQRFGETITDPTGHTGIDYALPSGTSVLAALSGKVCRVNSFIGSYGTHIILDHGNGLQTLYAHLSHVSVSFGESVTEGQIIGRSGNSGNSTGPHLHFEVRRKGKAMDPELLFAADPVGKAGWCRVKVPLLYVRSGPGTEYAIVGSLKQGEYISGDTTTETIWLKIGQNRWAAIQYQGEEFCEKVS